jgi:hypothetical protein
MPKPSIGTSGQVDRARERVLKRLAYKTAPVPDPDGRHHTGFELATASHLLSDFGYEYIGRHRATEAAVA